MSIRDTAKRRVRVVKESLTCKPLENLDEIRMFLENPPPWRTLCKSLVPHSKFIIRNIEHKPDCEPQLELPETFCHFDPDADVLVRHDVTVKKLQKTLVCHDMANGYHDDSAIEGTQHYDAYTFYNWAGIDIFCYFSHHLITIPPVSWINVGHAHGVKVIGTIITEWSEGTELWDKVLSSDVRYRDFASAVVAIAKTMNFDGWLLNIECKISNPGMLLEFVDYLHNLLHEELVEPVLIWYDSVTITGHLNWQNGLNAKNKAFFDKCDGFFTNYSWTMKDIEDTVKAAGDRVTDVYIGLDVWGRNFYGGGQFNLQQAVQVAHEVGCSMAIFAPAWTHEALGDSKAANITMAHETTFQQYLLRDRALWDSVWPYLNTHLPCKLPFTTSFCRGQGKKRWMYGEVISPGPWYNLRHQQYQPNSAHGPHGYVLSSMEKIMNASWINKDSKGIMKYRNDLNEIRSMGPESLPSDHNYIDGTKDTNEAQDKDDISSNDSFDETQSLKIKESLLRFKPLSEAENVSGTEPNASQGSSEIVSRSVSSQTHTSGLTSFMNKFKKIFKSKKREPKYDVNPSSSGEVSSSTSQGGSKLDSANVLEKVQDKRVKNPSLVELSVNVNLHLGESKIRWTLAHVPMERPCLMPWFDDAFNGGSCVELNPSDKISTSHRTIRLFLCDFECPDSIVICIVTKTRLQYADQSLNLKLSMKNSKDQDLTVHLMGKSFGLSSVMSKDSLGIVYSYPLNSEKQAEFRELRKYLLLNEPGFYVPIENLYGWEIRYHEVHVPESRVLEVYCRTALPEGGILLGHFGICRKHSNEVQPEPQELISAAE